MRNKRGVTLIILVITVIILLILAGITVSGLVNKNGAIDSTTLVKKVQSIETEREYLQKNTVLYQTQGSGKVGVELKQKNLKNSIDWHLIKTETDTFSDGWSFVGKGDSLNDFGNANHNWLINYETGEVILLEDDKFLSMSPGDMLAVKDSVILNVDSSIIDNELGNDKESLETQLGDGVTLENFNYNSESGLTTTSFKFDGVDDYIKIDYGDKTQREKLVNQGFTFEYYGSIQKGKGCYKEGNKLFSEFSSWWGNTYDNYNGIFCYWNGSKQNQATIRFGIFDDGRTIKWNAGIPPEGDPREKALSDLSSTEASGRRFTWNQDYQCKVNLNDGKRRYFTVTLDTSKVWKTEKGESYYKNTIYLNGEKLIDAKYNVKSWEVFKDLVEKDYPKYFIVGASTFHWADSWRYSKMDATVLRLYSRGLSEKEVMANYKKSVEYHDKLEEWAK